MELVIERREGDCDPHQTLRRHRRQQVEIAQHKRRLGDQVHRMVVRRQHFEDCAGDLQFAFDRLVDVGVARHHDRRDLVGRLRQLPHQHASSARLDEDLGLEIQPGRQAAIGVVGAGKAVDAAMLTALVGIDRAVEGNVGRGVVGDDRLRPLRDHLGPERGEVVFLLFPAVLDGLDIVRLEPAGGVGEGPASAGPGPFHSPVGGLRSRSPIGFWGHGLFASE